MIEKDLANLTCEVIILLTQIFTNNEISLESYISNTVNKIRFLETYIRNNNDCSQNIVIIKLIMQYKAISRLKRASAI